MPVTPVQINFPCIHSIVEVERQSISKKTGEQSNGKRIYLSSAHKQPPATVLEQIRLRWNVENKNHHPRDATFLEDKCRCHTRNTAANLALLRGAVLTIWKKTRPNLPAPAFTSRNQRKLDAMIDVMARNQRLRKME